MITVKWDMRHTLAVLLVMTLCGCITSRRAAHGPPDVPTALKNGFQREDHESFARRERELITAARQGIHKSGKLPAGASEDAYYRVRHTAEGYEVFVVYVTGYESGKPSFTPCVHNAVRLREDGSVLTVLVGPECWP